MLFLQKRCERLGSQSSQPARTLYFANVQQGRYDDALNVLERAMKMRPDDGDLLTYAAEARTHLGDFVKAEEILERAKTISKPAAYWRALALLATNQGDAVLARERWVEVLKIEPIAEDAHRSYCLLLAEKEGREAAVKKSASAFRITSISIGSCSIGSTKMAPWRARRPSKD
jgi:tetratricopeptide (TPR) repeat protein